MFSRTTRRAALTSIFATLLGASLSLGSVACVAPTGSEEEGQGAVTATAAATGTKEESPAKANGEEPQATDEDAGITAAPGTPSETRSVTGGGGSGYVAPEPARGGHEPVNAQ
jgi:hypothetical protein